MLGLGRGVTSAMAKACQDRCFEMLSIKVDPRFESLQTDPTFKAVLKQVGLD